MKNTNIKTCACGRPAVKRHNGSSACEKCIQIETRLGEYTTGRGSPRRKVYREYEEFAIFRHYFRRWERRRGISYVDEVRKGLGIRGEL